MNYFDRQKTNRIEKLEKKLYSKTEKQESDDRSEFDERKYSQLDNDWTPDGEEHELDKDYFDANETSEKPKKGLFFLTLLIAGIFFVGSVLYATFVFVGNQNTVISDEININIIGPVSVGSGSRLSLDIIVQNNSKKDLESVHLVTNYPVGTKTIDLKEDLVTGRMVIGDMPAGSVSKRTLDMAFLGERDEIKKIDLKIEYRLSGSYALFDKPKSFEIVLSEPPIQILVNAFEKVSSGQITDFDIKIRSNSEREIAELLFVADYPFGFGFMNSSIRPSYGNNVWLFRDFKPGETREIKITGQIQAQDNEERAFRFNIGTPSDINNEEIGVTFNNTRHVVFIEKPFIDLQLVINNSTEKIISVKSGESFNTNVLFTNNTNDKIRDIEIVLSLDGAVLDKSATQILGGFYSSFDNKITFNKDTYNQLAEVLPRQQVNITNTLKTFDLSSNNLNLKNPEIKISATVKGRRVRESGADESIEQQNFYTIKVLSDLILAVANNREKISGITDFGPIPPKVDNETSYTITWTVANSSADVRDAKVVARLPNYMKWNNVVVPNGENITYDETSRRITWNIGEISAGAGYSRAARTVNFQLVLRPSISQRQQAVVLLDQMVVTGFDLFNEKLIQNGAPNSTTVISGRSTFDSHQFVVE
ncbi:MAG TPA: hypothetical protein PKA60_02160 [Candidatus Paceibacterota bacterium]|nr:hypothetical protein [Candidatus Paceibacterota bacterium]